MSEREAKTILGNICYFCNTTPSVNNQQQSRNITVSNYKLLGIHDENLIEAKTYSFVKNADIKNRTKLQAKVRCPIVRPAGEN